MLAEKITGKEWEKKKKKELLLVNEKLVKINKKFEKKNSESRSHQPEAISLEVW